MRIRFALDAMRETYDVSFDGPPLRYIHKINQSRHVFLFANLGSTAITTKARLRGKLTPELWNPHDGAISGAVFTRETVANQDITTVELTLEPTRSVFVVSPVEMR